MHAPSESEHLIRFVEALLDAGNECTTRGFEPDQGGWDCRMRDPLDWEVLTPLIPDDPHAEKIRVLSDSLGCLHCWASISGPMP